jgi:putative membrane protein
MKKNIITLLLASCACGLLAYGQSNSSTTVSAADRMFIEKAAEGGMAEVQLGQLATHKASSQSVKDFGQRMVTDHSQANDQLKNIASTQGVPVPTSLTAKDQALYDRLSGLSGTAFDRAYMQAMVRDHNTDVAEFQKESATGKDQAVQSFASTTLPTLEDHLHMAKKVRHDLAISATAEANHTDESALQR